jgi:hypothetical protein
MAFNILIVRSAGDEDDPWYPNLDKSLMPVLTPRDGSKVVMNSGRGLVVSRLLDGKLKRVQGATGMNVEMWTTDHRVIVRSKNYDTVKWTGDNAVGAMIWGFGTEETFHLASKAYHRVRSMGKAMIGHVYMPWIRSIAYQPRVGRQQDGCVRIQVTQKFKDGSTGDRYLTVHVDKHEDPRAAAELILDRCMDWWDNHSTKLTDDQRESLGKVGEFSIPEPGKMSVVQLPVYRFTFTNNFND